MEMEDIYNTLGATMGTDNELRKAAEAHLTVLAATPGYLNGLLQVTLREDIPTGPRLSAALAFKRAVEQHWSYADANGRDIAFAVSPPVGGSAVLNKENAFSRYSTEERDYIRSQLLQAAVHMPTMQLINAFVDAIVIVFRVDFPDRWDTFVPEYVRLLTSGESHTTLVALMIFSCVCKMFEVDEQRALLIFKPVVEVVLPYILQICQYAQENINTDEGGHCIRLALKCLYNLCSGNFDVHECLLVQDTFIAWCGVAHTAMAKALPESGEEGEPTGMPVSHDARERWVWWGVKKWGTKIFYRLASVWGQPELLEGDALISIAHVFNKHIAPQVCGTMLSMMHDWQDRGRFLSKKILFYGIHMLQSCLDFSSCWKSVLKEELPFLLQQVVFSLFKMTPHELEMIEADPFEFMRMESDSAFTSTQPRKSAELFLFAVLEVRKAAAAPVLDQMLQGGLAQYEAQGVSERDPYFKEALMFLIQDLHNWLATDKERKKYIETMLARHVTPELSSQYPFLRSRAIAVWARYADMRFKSGDSMQEALQQIYGLMSDPVLVVKLTAGGSLQAFLARSKRARKILKPHMMELLYFLFAMLDELGMDEVVRTIGVVCDAYYDTLPDIAVALIEKLVNLWLASLGDLEDVDNGDADGAMFGEGLLSTVQTVIYQLLESKRMDTIMTCAPHVWRLCESLTATEGPTLEYLDSAFEIYGDMLVSLEDNVADIPEVWSNYLRIINLYTSCALDYTSSLLYPLDCLCVYCPERFAAEVDPTTGQDNVKVLVTAAAFVEEKGDEEARGFMTRILTAVLHYCRGLVDRVVPALTNLYANCLLHSHTKYLRSQAATVLGALLMYSPELTLTALETSGQSSEVFSGWLDAISKEYYKKSPDCKISMLGISSLIKSIPLASLPPHVAAFIPQLLAGVCSLQVQYETLLVKEEQQRKDEKDFDDELEDEDDLPDYRGDNAADADSDYEYDEADDGDHEEVGGNVEDDADFIKESDLVHKASLKAKLAETEEERSKRLESYLEEGDHQGRAPPKKTPYDHVHHLLWLQDAVGVLMAQPGAEHLQGAVDASIQAALGQLLTKAATDRAAGAEPGEFGPAPPGDEVEEEEEVPAE